MALGVTPWRTRVNRRPHHRKSSQRLTSWCLGSVPQHRSRTTTPQRTLLHRQPLTTPDPHSQRPKPRPRCCQIPPAANESTCHSSRSNKPLPLSEKRAKKNVAMLAGTVPAEALRHGGRGGFTSSRPRIRKTRHVNGGSGKSGERVRSVEVKENLCD
jgi:hypothetical protein